MKYSLRHARFSGITLALSIIAVDQWSKQFLLKALHSLPAPLEILSFFNLSLILNRGISFGMFSSLGASVPVILTVGASLIVLVLLVWLFRASEQFIILGLGFVIGGALGNIIDRVHYGFVVDFLDFHLGSYHWPAFKIADSAVFIGVVILALMSIVRPNNDL